MWRLDILQNPKLNLRAAPALAEAGLIIISLCGETWLPAKIETLIDERLAQTVNRGCALAALFEGAASGTGSSVCVCLASLARRHGLDFFEQSLSDVGGSGGAFIGAHLGVLTNLKADERLARIY